MDVFARDPQTYGIIGAAMEAHRELGCGFLEAVYQEALAIELTHRHIPFCQQVELRVSYRDVPLRCSYRADFLCFERVIVEIKAARALSGQDEAQVLNYLRASGLHTGLLLNFGGPSLSWRRLVW